MMQERRISDLATRLGRLARDPRVKRFNPRFRARNGMLCGPDGLRIRLENVGGAVLERLDGLARRPTRIARRRFGRFPNLIASGLEIADERQPALDDGCELELERPQAAVALLLSSDGRLELAELRVELREA